MRNFHVHDHLDVNALGKHCIIQTSSEAPCPTLPTLYIQCVDRSLAHLLKVPAEKLCNQWHEYNKSFPDFVWSDMHLECRFAVLELSDEFLALSGDFDALHSRLNAVRYHHGGINASYYGGDTRSWQRYTRREPIATDVKLCDTGIRCAVQERLVFGKLYALVILHSRYDHRFVLYEDKLFPFTVAKSPQQVAAEAETEAALALESEVLAATVCPLAGDGAGGAASSFHQDRVPDDMTDQ
jgi:hypothetical protein